MSADLQSTPRFHATQGYGRAKRSTERTGGSGFFVGKLLKWKFNLLAMTAPGAPVFARNPLTRALRGLAGLVVLALLACYQAEQPTGPNVATPALDELSGFASPPPPVSYWPADGHYDDAANGDNNGTPLGIVGFAEGKHGQAFLLDGTSELEVAHSADLELADGDASMSIAAWLKPTLPFLDTFHLGAVVSFNYACSAPAIGIHVADTGWSLSPHAEGVLFGVRDLGGVGPLNLGFAGIFKDGEWHHVVAVRDGTGDVVRVYVDGVQRETRFDGSGTVVPLRNDAGELITQDGRTLVSLGVNSPDRIGAISVNCATKRRYIGLIDEVKVWDVALTPEQVEAEYGEPIDLLGPVVSEIFASPNPAEVNSAITLAANVDDATTGGSMIVAAEYSVDGGGFAGMAAADGTFDEINEDVNVSIAPFSDASVHDICVRGRDIRGNVGTAQCILLAVYDPDAGFVTGAGWIDSPPGAYAPVPSLTGKATFGFVSRYQTGATVPEGQTQFRFKVADLNFGSSIYDWLVISGARAQYKGSGTINGMGDYGFMLTAIDGAIEGGGGIDKFRIKIWDMATETVLYDNEMEEGDTAEPMTAIGGGHIVIHKP